MTIPNRRQTPKLTESGYVGLVWKASHESAPTKGFKRNTMAGPQRVYLDTNIYSGLSNGEFSQEATEALFSEVASGRILVENSAYAMEEIIARAAKNPGAARMTLSLCLRITRPDRLIKDHRLLLEQAREYSEGRNSRPVEFRYRTIRTNHVWERMESLAESRITSDKELQKFANEITGAHRESRDALQRQLAIARRGVRGIYGEKRLDGWDEFVRHLQPALMSGIQDGRSLTDAQLTRLREIKFVDVFFATYCSRLYRKLVHGAAWLKQDWTDIFHAGAASLSECFITGDTKLIKDVSRIPRRSFEVKSFPDYCESRFGIPAGTARVIHAEAPTKPRDSLGAGRVKIPGSKFLPQAPLQAERP